MKQIAKIEFVHLNKVDYVIGMLKQMRDKAAKIYEPEDIQLLIKQTSKNTATVMFYLAENELAMNDEQRMCNHEYPIELLDSLRAYEKQEK